MPDEQSYLGSTVDYNNAPESEMEKANERVVLLEL
jgi:hypothetical protein